ncbi:MAG: Zn-ribbon domain-containing OB-fold protein [Candidatus Helarchaeota archaeon]
MSGEIIWKKCKKCGKIQYPTHVRCLNCKSKEFEEIKATGEGILLTYTILKAPPKEFRDKSSYTLGIVEFSNGIRALGQIITQENLLVGMKLKPKFQRICKKLDGHEISGNMWEPVE